MTRTPADAPPGAGVLAAVPPLLLLLGFVASWAWISLSLGGGVGPVKPPVLLSGAVVVGGAVLAVKGHPLFYRPSWLAFALNALSLFTFATVLLFLAPSEGLSAQEFGLVASLPRMGWLALAILLGVVQANDKPLPAVFFVTLFLAGEVARVPLEFSSEGVGMAGRLSAGIVATAIIETLVVAGGVLAYARGLEKPALIGIMGLLIVHPVLRRWAEDLGTGASLATPTYFQVFLGGAISLLVLAGLTFFLHRLRIAIRRGFG